jgi:hypothetical protein
MFDRETNRNKGFGFVTFEDDDGVDRAMEATGQELEGKPVSRTGPDCPAIPFPLSNLTPNPYSRRSR